MSEQVEFLSSAEQRQLARLANLENWRNGRPYNSVIAKVKKSALPEPITRGVGDRSQRVISWRKSTTVRANDITAANLPATMEVMKRKIEDETDYVNHHFGVKGPVHPEYNLLEPYTIIDTESYLLQAVRRRHSLMFRNGMQVSGEGSDANRDYIVSRFQQIGFVNGQTMENFFKEVLWNLLVCSNCVLVKIRDAKASGGTANKKNRKKDPVAAYRIVPIHTIFPVMDGKGNIRAWRRYFTSKPPIQYKDYPADDIVHFFWDRKPGHIFGTPRTAAVRDDIFALRRLEENIELLFIHHLFPLVHVQVGSREAPADYLPDGSSEVDFVRLQIENMPKEGVFVTDERVTVEMHSVKGQTLDTSKLLEHYKRRVYTGLGVSPIDMGETDSGNRSTAENVSQNLKDGVKADLSWFCEQVQMAIIRELFTEHSDERMSVQNAVAAVCLSFPEIDVDHMIKIENHAMNLYNNHLIAEDEARRMLKKQPMDNSQRKQTHFEQHVLKLAKETAKAKAEASGQAGVPATKSQPANQHGKNTDPHKARSSRQLVGMLMDALRSERETLTEASPVIDSSTWKTRSSAVVDDVMGSWAREVLGNSYTNQARRAMDSLGRTLKDLVSQTDDLDVLSVLLQEADLTALPGEPTDAMAEDVRLPDAGTAEGREQKNSSRV